MNKYKITAMVPMSVELEAENPVKAKSLFYLWNAVGMYTRGAVDVSEFKMHALRIDGPGCDKDTVLAILNPKPEPTEAA